MRLQKEVEMNVEKFTDGEELPVFGGPIDGSDQPVRVLFGTVPSHSFIIRHGRIAYRYKLDEARRRWVLDKSEKLRIKQ